MKSDLCDYNDHYILVKGDITFTATSEIKVSFKICAPFIKCITKIYETRTDDAQDLPFVMSMYNCIEYRLNYSETTGSLWLYSKDEGTDFIVNIIHTDDSKSFNYKT